ncbi:hypothetical protein GWK47_054101 [Chionoecetes opilio]|uniref:Uncharacterized protein n=1 Tax=Chionoecetes opilio TaxID=41210 RepID=A0A8J4XYM3_CHIOP|nr:hypothetical protein GWK47_054101 [Chionoecetes opilio]
MKNKRTKPPEGSRELSGKWQWARVDQELVRKETMRMKKLARKSERGGEKEKMAKAENFRDGGPFRLFRHRHLGPSPQENSPFRGETSSQVSSPPKKRLKVTPESGPLGLDRTNLSDRKATPSSRLWLPAQD